MDELDKQMKQRNALNQKLSALVAKRDKFVAEQRDKARRRRHPSIASSRIR